MERRILGRTGLEVSILSLGGAAFGNQYGEVSQEQVTACVHYAIEQGINLIDTSPYYGQTRSETVLGVALRGGWRDKILLCSKAGRNDVASFDFSPSALTNSVEASLKRLGTDYLDILIAHDIEFADDFEAIFTTTADTLHKLKRQGKCRFVGMSGYPLGILQRAIEQCNLDVVISYCHFSLQNTLLLTELLPLAEQYGVGLMNASPLSMGLLTPGGPPSWHPASAEVKAICRQAAEYCQSRGANLAFLGMQFCFQEPRIPTTISGAAKVEELEANLQALNTPIDPTLLAEVQAILAPIHNVTWPSGNWR